MRASPCPAIVLVVCVLARFAPMFAQEAIPRQTGEARTWHKITLTFDGPHSAESASPNPFTDYRLNVVFSQDERSYAVPGYFAADGDAANTGADSGDKWRVHFAPDSPGRWSYRVSFCSGAGVAVSDEGETGLPVTPWDGYEGELTVLPSNKTGRDMRAHGRLEYVGERYLKFAGTGEYFLKQGADAPENLLAYADFDGNFSTDGQKDNLVKTWQPHVRDWREGDPQWADGKGKGLIGAVNYLASEGMNAISFLTLNVGGDDRNVFPYTDYDERHRMDVSRLAQWEIVFEHMTRMGFYLHFKTQETENETLLDNGDVGPERRLYYRELIARFGHHPAMNWNLGEENGALGKVNQSTEQRRAMAQYFYDQDPYHHNIVIHNGKMPTDLLGDKSRLTGFSLQTNKPDFSRVHGLVLEWVRRSAQAGRPWVVACDEPGDASHALLPDSEDPEHDDARSNALWGTLMAGGAGNEWYFGYRHGHSDLTCQDWRSRDLWWDQCRIALEFFRAHVPFDRMHADDELVSTDGDYCLAAPDVAYLVYLRNGGEAVLDLREDDRRYAVRWFSPRHGGELQLGTVDALAGPGKRALGLPPSAPREDWAVLLTPAD